MVILILAIDAMQGNPDAAKTAILAATGTPYGLRYCKSWAHVFLVTVTLFVSSYAANKMVTCISLKQKHYDFFQELFSCRNLNLHVGQVITWLCLPKFTASAVIGIFDKTIRTELFDVWVTENRCKKVWYYFVRQSNIKLPRTGPLIYALFIPSSS